MGHVIACGLHDVLIGSRVVAFLRHVFLHSHERFEVVFGVVEDQPKVIHVFRLTRRSGQLVQHLSHVLLVLGSHVLLVLGTVDRGARRHVLLIFHSLNEQLFAVLILRQCCSDGVALKISCLGRVETNVRLNRQVERLAMLFEVSLTDFRRSVDVPAVHFQDIVDNSRVCALIAMVVLDEFQTDAGRIIAVRASEGLFERHNLAARAAIS